MPEIPTLLRERSKHRGQLCLRESLKSRHEQQVQQSSGKDWDPRCAPLTGCCFGDRLVSKVIKINLLSAFQPRFCVCSWTLPVLTHTHILGTLGTQLQTESSRSSSFGVFLVNLSWSSDLFVFILPSIIWKKPHEFSQLQLSGFTAWKQDL